MKGESREPPRTRGLRPAELAPPVLALLFFYITWTIESKEGRRATAEAMTLPRGGQMKRREIA